MSNTTAKPEGTPVQHSRVPGIPARDGTRWGSGVVLAVFLLIASFYLLTIRRGHQWGDDFALYIHHAENLALQQPYAATGYLYNKYEPTYTPRAYPPLFPVLLTPVYKVFGRNLEALKVETTLFFLLSLGLTYWLFRRELTLPYRLLLLAVAGMNPVLWASKDSITSDYPFLFFFLLAALVLREAPRDGRSWRWALLAGLVLYGCYGMRSIGLMFLPGVFLYEYLTYKRLTRFSLVAVLTCVGLIALQTLLFPTSESSYAAMFQLTVSGVLANLKSYMGDLSSLWPHRPSRILSLLLFGAVTLLAGYGWFQRGRRWMPVEALLVFYLCLVAIWPANQGIRFLLPLIPAYLGYAVVGYARLNRHLPTKVQWATLGVVLVAVATSYRYGYARYDHGTIPEATGLPAFNDLCAYLRSHTAPNDVMIFHRARALTLFSGRPASIYIINGTPEQAAAQWEHIRQVRAKYVIFGCVFPEDERVLRPVIAEHAAELKLVYENAGFQVYEVQPPA